jgi:hypothetical protein
VIRRFEWDSRYRLTAIKDGANEVLACFQYGDKDQILKAGIWPQEGAKYAKSIQSSLLPFFRHLRFLAANNFLTERPFLIKAEIVFQNP